MTFSLEAYEPNDDLPQNARLYSPQDLVGHKIVAVIEDCIGHKADGSEMMIVTETGCWIVLAPTGDSDGHQIIVESGRCVPDNKAISDYASARQMLSAGLITQAQCDFILFEEAKREVEKKARRADALRKELARLEGTA